MAVFCLLLSAESGQKRTLFRTLTIVSQGKNQTSAFVAILNGLIDFDSEVSDNFHASGN